MWLSGNWLSPGRICWGTGGHSLLTSLWSASHLCSFFPMIDDLVLTRSDLSPLPVLWDQLLASRPSLLSDLQVVPGATYTCFSWCTVHLATRQDLQFHPSQGAEKGLGKWRCIERGCCLHVLFYFVAHMVSITIWWQRQAWGPLHVCPVRKIWKNRHMVLIAAIAGW